MRARSGRPRLLIYSQDGLGLGHLRRTTLLAAQFLRARPDGSVLTVCDSPTGQFFSSAPGHDHLKLPSVRKIRPGEWSPVSLSLSFADLLEMRKAMIRAAAVSFDPDVLLVDHMPHGAMGELVPTLEALSSSRVRTVLGLRDILDAPETIRRRWHLEGAFEAVERHYDAVLVYGSQDVFDLAENYGWPDRLVERIHYCGYVCSPAPASTAEAIRRRYLHHLPGAALVVGMAGGGADAYPLLESLVRAAPEVTAHRSSVFVLVTGPFLPDTDRGRLQRLAEGKPVHVLRAVEDSLGYLAAADVVVAMAGYNTTAEILKVGVPAVLVPRPGPSAEQTMRASRLAARGWVHWLPAKASSAQQLASAVTAALRAPAVEPATRPDLLGLQRAARHLVEEPLHQSRAGRARAAAVRGAGPPGGPSWSFDEG